MLGYLIIEAKGARALSILSVLNAELSNDLVRRCELRAENAWPRLSRFPPHPRWFYWPPVAITPPPATVLRHRTE